MGHWGQYCMLIISRRLARIQLQWKLTLPSCHISLILAQSTAGQAVSSIARIEDAPKSCTDIASSQYACHKTGLISPTSIYCPLELGWEDERIANSGEMYQAVEQDNDCGVIGCWWFMDGKTDEEDFVWYPFWYLRSADVDGGGRILWRRKNCLHRRVVKLLYSSKSFLDFTWHANISDRNQQTLWSHESFEQKILHANLINV